MTVHSEDWYLQAANREKLRDMVEHIATTQIGVTELPFGSNHQKYGKWFGFDGAPWCAMFVSWVYARACEALNVPNPLAGWQTPRGFAGVTSAFSVIQKRFPHYLVPKVIDALPGDIFFMDHDRKPGGNGHTELYVGDLRWIGGNTNQEGTGSYSRNGGMVAMHTHPMEVGSFGAHGLLLGIARPTRRFYQP